MTIDDSPMPLGQLLALPSKIHHWGPWRIDNLDYTVFNAAPPVAYRIPLLECADPASALFWIHHIAGKGWGPDVLPGLVGCLGDALDLSQGILVQPDAVRSRIDTWAAAGHPGISQHPLETDD